MPNEEANNATGPTTTTIDRCTTRTYPRPRKEPMTNHEATPAESTTPPPTVNVALRRRWGQAYTWVAMNPCPYCGTTRHIFNVPKGRDPATLLGEQPSPCGQGSVLLMRD